MAPRERDVGNIHEYGVYHNDKIKSYVICITFFVGHLLIYHISIIGWSAGPN